MPNLTLAQVQIESDFPEMIDMDSKLFKSLFRNLANNTEVHSTKGSVITLRLWIVGDVMYAQFVNEAGDNHQCCRDLQSKHGKLEIARVVKYPLLCTPGENFLLYKFDQHLASANDIGSKNSTFLGMREISAVATLIHAEVSLVFEEHNVVTTLQLAYVKVLSTIKLATLGASPTPPEAFISTAGLLDYSRIVFFCCDDDKYPLHTLDSTLSCCSSDQTVWCRAPRTMAMRMLQILAAHANSRVLGETYQEILSVLDLILQAKLHPNENTTISYACSIRI